MALVLLLELFCWTISTNFLRSEASTHWIVTEDGRIQAKLDSLFNINRPYDLIAFFDQEVRAELLELNSYQLIKQKEQIDREEDKDTDLEERLYKEEIDCIIAGKPLIDFDLYISTLLPLQNKNINYDDFLPKISKYGDEPNCVAAIDLPFSMHAFEHLPGVQLRNNLSSSAEHGLKNAVSPIDSKDIFASKISKALETNKTSWVLYNMAAFYWRIKGNAFNVVECLRRALHFSERENKDVALISLANILHRARRSEEAIVVLDAAIDISGQLNVNYFTLGNIYAVLGDYNKSINSFDKTLKMQSNFEVAYKRKHAVKCQEIIENKLEIQHKNLQKTLNDLKDFQKRQEILHIDQAILMREKLAYEYQNKDQIAYELFKKQKSLYEFDEVCYGREVLNCFWAHKSISSSSFNVQNNLQDVFPSWPPYLNKTQQTIFNNSDNLLKSQMQVNDLKLKEKIDMYRNPTAQARFIKRQVFTIEEQKKLVYKDKNWPDKESCDHFVQKIPSSNDFPTNYLQPENKGFEMELILSDGLGLKKSIEHALPWYQPICNTLSNIPSSKLSYDHLESIKMRAKIPLKLVDENMMSILQAMVPEATEEEIGQRILSALNLNIGPTWLLYNAAGLYWRAISNNYYSIECLRQSLYYAPNQYRDIPLVNLANILFNWGHIDDAIKLAYDALEISDLEPETHFLLANLLSAKGNSSGAIHHYEECLNQQPNHEKAMVMLRSLSCEIKYHRPKQSVAPNDVVACKKIEEYVKENQNKFMKNSNILINAGKMNEITNKNSCSKISKQIGKRRPQIKLEFINGKLHQRIFIGDRKQIFSSEDCIIFNDGSRSNGCKKEYFKNYESSDHITVFHAIAESDTQPNLQIDKRELVKRPILERHITSIASIKEPSLAECHRNKTTSVVFSSTWISLLHFSIINITKYVRLNNCLSKKELKHIPYCHNTNNGKFTDFKEFHDIKSLRNPSALKYTGEPNMITILPNLFGFNISIDLFGARLANTEKSINNTWVLTMLSSLYWRIKGNSSEAIKCLYVAYKESIMHSNETILLSLVQILYFSREYRDAENLMETVLIREKKSNFNTHFIASNLLLLQGDFYGAKLFLLSSLKLNPDSQVARNNLYVVDCYILEHKRQTAN